MYPGTVLHGQTETLFTYCVISFHLGISKSFIMLLSELIKPHNFTKHCIIILYKWTRGRSRISLSCVDFLFVWNELKRVSDVTCKGFFKEFFYFGIIMIYRKVAMVVPNFHTLYSVPPNVNTSENHGQN